jgi:hypothetical protein
MNVDPAIQAAIRDSVKRHGQEVALADKLIRWFDEVVSGNEDIDSEDAVYKRLDLLFRAVETAEPQEDKE